MEAETGAGLRGACPPPAVLRVRCLYCPCPAEEETEHQGGLETFPRLSSEWQRQDSDPSHHYFPNPRLLISELDKDKGPFLDVAGTLASNTAPKYLAEVYVITSTAMP